MHHFTFEKSLSLSDVNSVLKCKIDLIVNNSGTNGKVELSKPLSTVKKSEWPLSQFMQL